MEKVKFWIAALLAVVVFTTCDNLGLGSEVNVQPPKIDITSPEQNIYVREAFTLSGTASDDRDVEKVEVFIDEVVFEAEKVPGAEEKSYTWTVADIDTTAFTDGEKEVLARVTDSGGSTTEMTWILKFDNTKPLVLMKAPEDYSADDTVKFNGDITIKGDAADNFRIEKILLSLHDSEGNALIDNEEVTGTSTWSYTLKTKDFQGSPLQGQYSLSIAAHDKAGNVSEYLYHVKDLREKSSTGKAPEVEQLLDLEVGTDSTNGAISNEDLAGIQKNFILIYIDQASDLPVLKSLSPDGEIEVATKNLLSTTSRILVEITDDDGIAAGSIYASLDTSPGKYDAMESEIADGKWYQMTKSSSTQWELDLGALGIPEGLHSLNIRAADIYGTIQFLSGLTSAGEVYGKTVSFYVDDSSPSLTVANPVGGSYYNDAFTMNGTVTDGSGISVLKALFKKPSDEKASEVALTPNSAGAWAYNVSVDKSGHANDGTLDITIYAEDLFGRSYSVDRQVIIDTQAPTVNFLFPASGTSVNESVQLKGSSSDNFQLEKIYLKLSGGNKTIVADGVSNFDSGSSNYSWSKTFNSTGTFPNGALTATLTATDKAGNSTSSNWGMTVDSTGDNPSITITSDTEHSLTTQQSISGLFKDDDTINPATAKIKLVPQGTDAGSVAFTNLYSSSVSGTSEMQWSYGLSGNDFGSYTAYVQVSDTKASAADVKTAATNFAITIDDGAPSLSVNRDVLSTYYKATDTLTITGSASDGYAISDIQVKLPGGTYTSLPPADIVSAANPAKNFASADITAAEKQSVTWTYSVAMSALPDNQSSLQFIALDASNPTPNKSATETVYVTKDSVGPAIMVNSHLDNATLEEVVTIKGEISDIYPVDKNRFSYLLNQTGNSADGTWKYLSDARDVDNLDGDGDENTHPEKDANFVLNGNLWTLTLDSTAFTNNPLYLFLKAKDFAGNETTDIVLTQPEPDVTVARHTFQVDQLTDKPVIYLDSFDNTTGTAVPGDNGFTNIQSIQGRIEDDDIDDKVSIASIQIKITEYDNDSAITRNWTAVTNLDAVDTMTADWTYPLNTLPDGKYKLWVRAFDTNATGTGDARYETTSGVVSSSGVPFLVDSDPPQLTITSHPTDSDIMTSASSMTLAGTAEDQMGVNYIKIRVPTSPGATTYNEYNIDAGNATSYTWSREITLPSEGNYLVDIISEDAVGKVRNSALTFIYDATVPTVSVDAVDSSYLVLDADHPESLGADSYNGAVKLTGNVSDDLTNITDLVVSVNGGSTWVPVTGLAEARSSSFSVIIDTVPLGEGMQNVLFKATDAAGNFHQTGSEHTLNLYIAQASDSPYFTFTDIIKDTITDEASVSADDNRLTTTKVLRGTLNDDDGIDRTTVEISIDGGGWNVVSNPPSVNGKTVDWSHDVSLLTEGSHKFDLRVYDKASLKSFGSYTYSAVAREMLRDDSHEIWFAIDNGAPSASYEQVNTGVRTENLNGAITSSSFTFEGNVSDGNGLAAAGLDTNNDSIIDIDLLSEAADWDYTFTGLPDGSKTINFIAKDNFNNVTTDSFTFTVDTTPPQVTFTSPSAGAALNNAVLVTGTADDVSTTVASVEIWDGTQWQTAAGTTTWSAVVNIDAFGANGDTVDLKVRATDAFGNVHAVGSEIVQSVNINLDDDLPEISYSGSNLSDTVTSANYTNYATLNTNRLSSTKVLRGTLIDDDGIDKTTVEISFDGGTGWETVSTPPTNNGTQVDWSHDVSNSTDFPEGTHYFRIRAKDYVPSKQLNGSSYSFTALQTEQSEDIYFAIDNGAPSLSINDVNINGSDVVLNGATVTSSFSLSGTVSDGNGIKSFGIDYNNTGTVDELVTVAGGNWSKDFSYAADGSEDGTKTIRIVATDNFDNERSAVISYVVDTTAPTIVVNSPAAGSTLNGAVKVSGTASDSGSSVSKVEVFDGTDWITANGTLFWSAVIRSENLGNGAQDIMVRAEDTVGNIHSGGDIVDLSVTVDQSTDNPVISFAGSHIDSSIDLESEIETGVNQLLSSKTLRGTLIDDDAIDKTSVKINIDGGGYNNVSGQPGSNGTNVDWSHDVSGLSEGNHSFTLTVSDLPSLKEIDGSSFNYSAANTVMASPVWFAIDNGAPALTVNQVNINGTDKDLNGSVTDADFTLSGTVYDGNDLSSLTIEIDEDNNGTYDTTYNPVIAGDPSAGTASWSFDFSFAADHSEDGFKEIKITAIDDFGNPKSEIKRFTVDTTAPTVSITNLYGTAAVSGLNGLIQMKGSTSDANKVETVEIAVVPATTAVADASWTTLSGTYGWEHWFDSTIISGTANYVIYVKATDGVGNSMSNTDIDAAKFAFYIDQTLDDPTFSFTNLQAGGTAAQNLIGVTKTGLTGTVADDDGITKSSVTIEFRKNSDNSLVHQDTVTIAEPTDGLTQYSWTYSLPGNGILPESTDSYEIIISASDIGESSGAPYNLTKAANSNTSASVLSNLDRSAPTISMSDLTAGTVTVSGDANIPGSYFKDNFELDGIAYDALGLSSIELTADSVSGFADLTDTGGGNYTWTFDTSTDLSGFSPSTGAMDLQLVVTDTNGRTTTRNLQLIVDTSTPTIEFVDLYGTTARNTDGLNGLVHIKGVSSDNNKVNNVQYALITNDGSPTVSDLVEGDWQDLSGTYSWEKWVDTTAIATGDFAVFARAYDGAGNVTSDADINANVYTYKVYKQGDVPTFTFGNLAAAGSASDNLIGLTKTTLSGTVSDDDGISRDTVQITFSNTGDSFTYTDDVTIAESTDGLTQYNWSYTLPSSVTLPESATAYTISLSADDVGETGGSLTKTAVTGTSANVSSNIDRSEPLLTLSSYSAGTVTENVAANIPGSYLNDSFTLAGTATDGVIGIEKVEISLDGEAPATLSLSGDDWTFSPSGLSYPDGALDVVIVATDNNGRTKTRNMQLIVDSSAPEVEFVDLYGSTQRSNGLNGLVHIKGVSSDNNKVNNVQYALIENDGSPTVSDLIEGDWQDLAGIYSWDHWVDTTSIDTGNYAVFARAYDGAGNVTEDSVINDNVFTYSVLKSSDNPTFTFSNLASGGSASENLIGVAKTVLNGTVSDDDGVDRDSVRISFTNTGDAFTLADQAVTIAESTEGLTQYSWSYTLPDNATLPQSSNPYTITLSASDVGESGGSLTKTAVSSTSAGVASNLDRNAPVIGLSSYTAGTVTINTAAEIPGSYLNSSFTLSGTATDDNGISGVTVKVGILDPVSAGLAGSIFTYTAADLASAYAAKSATLEDGAVDVQIVATDTNGRTSTKNIQLVVDSTPPIASFIDLYTTSEKANINGAVHFKGTGGDNNKVAKVEIAITSSDVDTEAEINAIAENGTIGTDGWTEISGATYSWDYWWNSSSESDGNWAAFIRSTDGAGNVSTSASMLSEVYTFTTFQDADIPSVSVSNVQSNYAGSGKAYVAESTLTGTISDDDGVDTASLYISFDNWSTETQITPDGSGKSTTWSYDLSGRSEGIQTIDLRIADSETAKEAGHSFDLSQETYYLNDTVFYIDRNAPVLSGVEISSDSGDISGTSFTDGIFVDEDFTLNGSLTEVNTVSSFTMEFSYDGSSWSTAAAVSNDGTNYDSWFSAIDYTDASYNGEIQIRLVAADEFGKSSQKIYRVNSDVDAPSVALVTPSVTTGINGSIILQGSASDNESQISKVEYTFKPDGSGWTDITANGKYYWEIPSFDTTDLSQYISGTQASLPGTGTTGELAGLNDGTFHVWNGSSWTEVFDGSSWNTDVDIDFDVQLKVRITDQAGNTNFADESGAAAPDYTIDPSNGGVFDLSINQYDDKPVVSFTNVSLETSQANAGNNLLESSPKLQGTITDDDNVTNGNVDISFDNGSSWNPVTVTSGKSINWTYNLYSGTPTTLIGDVSEGDNSFILRVRDDNYAGSTAWYNEYQTQRSWFSIDLSSPTISISSLDLDGVAGGGDDITTGLQGKNINADYYIMGTASDPNNVSLEVELDNSDTWTALASDADFEIVSDDGNGNVTWRYLVDTTPGTAFEEKAFAFRASDDFTKTSSTSLTLNVDTKVPTVSFTDLLENDDINGLSYRVTGTTSDENIISSVTFAYQGPGDASYSTPVAVGNSVYNWYGDIDLKPLAYYADGTGNMAVQVVATDKAGNQTTQNINLSINQPGDTPDITVTTPSASEVLGSTALAVGYVTDDDEVDASSITIDIYNGVSWSFGNSPTSVGSDSKTVNWTYDLSGLDDGSYQIRVNASDTTSGEALYTDTSTSPIDYEINRGAAAITISDSISDNGLTAGFDESGMTYTNGAFIQANEFGIGGTVTHSFSVDSIEVSVDGGSYSATGVVMSDLVGSDGIADTWTAVLSGLSDDSHNISVRSVRGDNRYATATIQLNVDTSPPSINFASHEDNDDINKAITLSGSASDTQGFDRVEVEIYNQTNTNWESLTVAGSYSWSVAGFNTVTYNTADYDTNGGTSGVQIQLRATAYDSAGNSNSVTRTLNIDQNTDRPVVRLTNVNPDGNSTLKLAATVYGSVTDDDSTVSTFEMSLDGITWDPITLSGNAWEVNLENLTNYGGDGQMSLYFRVTDSVGTVFATNDASSQLKPRIYVDGTTYSEDALTLRVDKFTPEMLSDIKVDRAAPFNFAADANTVTLTTNMPFGGNSEQFAVRVLAKDANGIEKVEISVPGLDGNTSNGPGIDPFPSTYMGDGTGGEAGYGIYHSDTIDVSPMTAGAIDLVVIVTDNSGLTSTATRTIIIDNDAPTVNVTYPLVSDRVNGNLTVKGTASDGGSGTSTIQYQLGYNYDSDPNSAEWQLATGSVFNWEIDFAGANKVELYAGLEVAVNTTTDELTLAGHGYNDQDRIWISTGDTLPASTPALDRTLDYYVDKIDDDNFRLSTTQDLTGIVDFTTAGSEVRVSAYSKDTDANTIWEVPINIRTEDTAGNVEVTTPFVMQVDPTGDRPYVDLVYPDPDGGVPTLGGTIRIFGTAGDDDGVKHVYMQIDTNNDDVYDASDVTVDPPNIDWFNDDKGQIVNGTVSWNQAINGDGEFNPTVGDTRTIKFRVRVEDINGVFSVWSPSYEIKVDANVPQIGSTDPLTLTQGAAQQTYVAGSWLKGDWVLGGSVEDESGITDISLSGDITGNLNDNPGWFVADEFEAGKFNYDLNIPITTVADQTGSVEFTISVTDGGEGASAKTITQNISVKYDNQAPVISVTGLDGLDANTPIVQSNKTFTLSSSLDEGTGSQFGKVAFYLVRPDQVTDSVNYDRIYNPANSNQYFDVASAGLSQDANGIYYMSYDNTGVSRTDDYTLVDTRLAANPFVKKGGYIRIGGIDRKIVSWDGTDTITWAEEVSTSENTYSIAYAQFVDNITIETPVYNQSSGILESISNDDGDLLIETVERAGGLYNWSASIDSKYIPDGPIEIHWISFDQSGNYVGDSLTTSIANNQPLLASIKLWTDLNENTTVENYETSTYSALDVTGQEQKEVTIVPGATVAPGTAEEYVNPAQFTMNGTSSAELTIVGGNGQIQYTFYSDTTEVHALSNMGSTIDISVSELEDTIGDGSSDFIFSLWDSTEEMTAGLDPSNPLSSLNAKLTIPVSVKMGDDVPSVAVIDDLYWNSTSDNSLYLNSRDNGHIEINSVTGGAGPDVSGTISYRGTSFDDQKITALWANLDGFGFNNTASLMTKVVGGNTYTRIATYDGTWNVNDELTSNGWNVTVANEYLNQDGHLVNWQLDWNSARVTNVAALNRTLRILTDDKGFKGTADAFSTTTITDSDLVGKGDDVYNGYTILVGAEESYITDFESATGLVTFNTVSTADASYQIFNSSPTIVSADPANDPVNVKNVPDYVVDVVPYIKTIATDERTEGGLKEQNIRSASGKYSVITGSTNDFITISGFNLDPDAVRIVDSTEVSGTVTTATGSGLNYSGVDTTYYNTLSVSNNSNTSGYLEIFTNGIRSLNNMNDNDAKGDYAGTDPQDMINREPDLYTTKNLTLSDDRYLRYFKILDTGIKNAYYPNMLMNGNNPVFGYVDLNGVNSSSYIRTYQNQCYQAQRTEFNGTTGAFTDIEYLIGGLTWDQMAMARDDDGKYIQASVYNYSGARISVIFDRYAEQHTWSSGFYTDGWGGGVQYSGYGGVFSGNESNNAINLESTSFGNGTLIGRFQNMKLLAKGDSSTATGASIYMAYYDDNTTNSDLIFRTFKIGNNNGWTNTLRDGDSNLPENNESGREIIASGASSFYDMAVTSTNRVVFVYYDLASSSLKLVYSTTAIDGSDITPNATWQTSTVNFPSYVGNYVSMTLDASDGIHIAAYDAGDSDLVYMYLPAYDSTNLTSVTVDQAFSVGTWTKIQVQSGVPYIAYYNSTETGSRDSIKMAYCNSVVSAGSVPAGVDSITGYTTGNWEYMTVPAFTPPQGGDSKFRQVNLDFNSSGKPVIGYLGTNLEFGYWLDE